MADAHHDGDGHDHGDGEAQADPRQLAAQFELVQRELQRMERRLETLQQALIETQQAAAALRELGSRTGTQETLVSIGAGVQVHGSVDVGKKVLVPVGAGYAVEKTFDEAVAALEQRATDVTRTFEKASSDADRLANIANSMQAELQQQGLI